MIAGADVISANAAKTLISLLAVSTFVKVENSLMKGSNFLIRQNAPIDILSVARIDRT